MKYLTILLIAIFWNTETQAQTYEIGGFIGGSNVVSDIGSTSYFSPNKPVFGAILKWNRSSRHSFRFTALFTELEGNDEDSHESRRQSRGLSFTNSLQEISLGLEYTFWEFDMFKDRNANAPYLYTGLTVFNQENISNIDGVTASGNALDVAIPIVLGYKVAVNNAMVIALEGGARYTFTDNIDGSNPAGEEALSLGNKNNNDWYVFTGLTVSFTFGRRPCYCGF
ncbi:DUF6089 family protein [uncultured Dokdonia sp.]|uniref:type IX secretion system protein PorG n=1 Tax=uncultured Dokdonia sp. TaxID=575653 RepID=UPI0026343784|nr:DUF6089 family protein [uncultured Dokdonia sp.]